MCAANGIQPHNLPHLRSRLPPHFQSLSTSGAQLRPSSLQQAGAKAGPVPRFRPHGRRQPLPWPLVKPRASRIHRLPRLIQQVRSLPWIVVRPSALAAAVVGRNSHASRVPESTSGDKRKPTLVRGHTVFLGRLHSLWENGYPRTASPTAKNSQAFGIVVSPAILDHAMRPLHMLRRIWNRPFGGAFLMAILFGLVLIAAQVDRIWGPGAEERARVERLEQLLWRQAGAGQIASALEQLELAEMTGAIQPERAEEIRKRLEGARAELRRRVRVLAERLARQKLENELKQQ